MAKVSVIIPVYGVEKYIERCAISLFEQTLDDMEFLFIDDCTPDRSIEVLLSVLDRYPQRRSQVKIHHMSKNVGQAKVREWGMKNVTGEYVIHCDSDDWVENTMYEKMHSYAIAEDVDAVVCDYYMYFCEKDIRYIKGACNIDNIINEMLEMKVSWSLCNKLIKRNIVENCIEKYPVYDVGEDMVLTFQLLIGANSVGHIKNALYYYWINPCSSMANSSSKGMEKRYFDTSNNIDLLQLLLKNEYKLDAMKLYCQSLLIVANDFANKNVLLHKYKKEVVRAILNPTLTSKTILISKLVYMAHVVGLYPFYKKVKQKLRNR